MREIDKEVTLQRVEQRGGVEVTTFLKVKDPTDPLNVNQIKSFLNLAINHPKDIEMSDPGTTDHNDNNKAEARFDSVAKANLGSNMSHLAEPLNQNQTSAADVYMKDKEKQDRNSGTEEVVEDVKVEEEEVEEEVKIIVKIKGKGEDVEEVVKKTKGASRPGALWGAANLHIKEVKATV